MKKTTIVETITILFIILFLYTGISKVMDYSVFKEQIATSPILAPVSKLIAAGVPAVEFLVVFLLAIPRWRLKGLYASLILMILFTGYITALLSFSDQLPCSCGGVIELMSWSQHIIFNSLFIALAVVGVVLQKQLKKSFSNEWASINSIWKLPSKESL
jgi:uncharacterized membrane protein YphA (DoxX/SURF4 family)